MFSWIFSLIYSILLNHIKKSHLTTNILFIIFIIMRFIITLTLTLIDLSKEDEQHYGIECLNNVPHQPFHERLVYNQDK